MTEEIKDGTSAVAVEEGKADTPAVENTQNGGEQVTQPNKNEDVQPFKVFKTQTDFDNLSAKIKGSAERELFKKLGIKTEADLEKVKTAYEASLTEAEKNAQTLAQLEEIKKQSLRKDYVINALAKKVGEPMEDVEKQVTMAESLLTAGHYSTFDEAFEFVRGVRTTTQEKQVPQGKNITQPDIPALTVKNPFKKGADYSLSAQMELYKKDKELARRLASEAGITLN